MYAFDGSNGNGMAQESFSTSMAEEAAMIQNADSMMSLFDGDMLATVADDMAMNIDMMETDTLSQMMGPNAVESSAAASVNGDATMADKAGPANVPGGGPSPASGPPQPNSASQAVSSASGITEFTKRRNWPARVVEELQDNLQILDASGRIKYASPSITEIAGYDVEDFKEHFLKDFIHPDDHGLFLSEFNEAIASGTMMRLYFRLKKSDGTYCIIEAVGHAHVAAAKYAPNPNNQSPFCQAVFLMARPYPSKNSRLLDSFLEHKIENERLRRRIAELRQEEMSDAGSMTIPSMDGMSETRGTTSVFSSTPRSVGVESALTRENLEGSSSSARQEPLREKMARLDDRPSHGETIEMLTGLRYSEGERSRGITTGNTSPALITGDVGIAMPKDPDGRSDKKKKKLKVAEEYVCTDCGTLDSPEWRKGPSGPKTLCNACGLRWAKKEKKRQSIGKGAVPETPSDYNMSMS